jgi:biopolymer transport protein ExbD
MRFLLRKRKQTPTVIIVALIDVLIVLLIFLMVTTTFKQQPAIRIALPESSQAQKSGADEKAPLIVSVDAKGALRLGSDAVPVTGDRLKAELLAQVQKDPELKLAISADKDAPFGQIVQVLDAAKEAHINTRTVNAFTREAAKQ